MKSLSLAPIGLSLLVFACSPLPTVNVDSGNPTGNGGQTGSGNGGTTTTGNGGSTGNGGGSGGNATGTGGNGGATDGGSTGGAGGAAVDPNIQAIKDALNGANKWVLPCGVNQSYSDLVCVNNPMNKACPLPPANPTLMQYVFANTLNRNDMITLPKPGGDGIYTVTARFQGVVEPKHYGTTVGGRQTPCVNQTPVAGTTPVNPGFCAGTEPIYSGNYNVYMIWVSSPTPAPTMHNGAGTALAGQYYWLNNIGKNEEHFSYLIDYTVTFPVAAGAMMQFVADDSNCSAIRNCDTTSTDQSGGRGICNMLTVPQMPTGTGITQPYNGQFIIMTVLDVKKTG